MYSEKPINHTLKNQHIRYVPRERLNFDTMTPDGKVALVYRSDQTSRMNVWNVILGSAIPPALFAPYLVPPDLLLYSYTALFLPSMYALFDRRKRKQSNKGEIDEMYIFENGEQLLVRTADGVLHKLEIIHNMSHSYEEGRDKALVFIMENSKRRYSIKTKDAEVIDYQLLDKFMRAICIDTHRTQNLYHRLISRQ